LEDDSRNEFKGKMYRVIPDSVTFTRNSKISASRMSFFKCLSSRKRYKISGAILTNGKEQINDKLTE
jgi:hypothetical protein